MSQVSFKINLSKYMSGDLSKPENSAWLVYAVVIVEEVGSASYITELWKYVQENVKDEGNQLTATSRIRKVFLKGSPLVGFPKVSPLMYYGEYD